MNEGHGSSGARPWLPFYALAWMALLGHSAGSTAGGVGETDGSDSIAPTPPLPALSRPGPSARPLAGTHSGGWTFDWSEWGAPTQACSLDEDSRKWIQTALDDWGVIGVRLLGGDIPRSGLVPWMIFFDDRCVWSVARVPNAPTGWVPSPVELRNGSGRVPVWQVEHEGMIQLPNGSEVPAQPMAATSFDREERLPFTVMATLSLWRDTPSAIPRHQLVRRLRGVLVHELAHTVHVGSVSQSVSALARQYPLPPSVGEHLIQETFELNSAFKATIAREVDLLFLAVLEPDEPLSKATAKEALNLARERRQTHYHGDRTYFAVLEDRFWLMEGVAEWARHELLLADSDLLMSTEERLDFLRGTENEWAQDEGLALLLLIDRWVPDWTDRLRGPDATSPFKLLAAALDADWPS